MKKIIALGALLAVLGTPGMLQAQNTGGQKSKFIRPIAIAPVNDAAGATINFGVIVPGANGGTVNIAHDVTWGNPATPGFPGYPGPTILDRSDDRPKAHAADWVITGEPNYTFEITTSNPTTLSLADGTGATMTMNWLPAWVFVGGTGSVGGKGPVFGAGQDPGAGSNQYTNWISILNSATIGVTEFSQGGGITVGAHQQPGLYVGTWTETVDYN